MKKLFQPEDLEKFNYLSYPAISSEGTRFAWVVSRGSMEDGTFSSAIFFCTRAQKKPMAAGRSHLLPPEIRTLESPDGSSQKHPCFCGENLLFYLSDETGEFQVFSVDLDSGAKRQLTSLRHGVKTFSLSGDGKRLVFEAALWDQEIAAGTAFLEMTKAEKKAWAEELDNTPYVAEDLVCKMDDWYGMRKGEYSHIGIYSGEDGSQRLLSFPEFLHMECEKPSISEDGQRVLFYGYPHTGAFGRKAEVFVCMTDGAGCSQITDGPEVYPECPPLFAGTNKAVFSAFPAYEDGSTVLTPYLASLDEKESAPLLGEWEEEICHGIHPLVCGRTEYGEQPPTYCLDEKGKGLCFLSGFHGIGSIFWLSLAERGHVKKIVEGKTDILSFAADRYGNLLYLMATPQKPAELYYFRNRCADPASGCTAISYAEESETKPYRFCLERGETAAQAPAAQERKTPPIPLTDSNPWMREYAWGEVREYHTQTADEKEELSWYAVLPPSFEENHPYPAVVDIKGGPETVYHKTFWHEFQALAARGFVVICPNIRGSAGFGRRFCADGIAWKNEALEDIRVIVEDSVRMGLADPARIGVTGGSYGGYMTNKLIGRTSLFAAAVTQRSLVNPVTSYGTGDMGFVSSKAIPENFRMMDYLEDRARGNIISYIDQMNTPLLILHGYRDYRCSFEQAEQLFAAMKDRKPEVPVRMVVFPEENHGITRTGKLYNQIRHLQEMADWFSRYLR